MKPTTEQIIDWGRTALNETGALIPAEWNMKLLEAICSAAYEAGRKDENEACAKLCEQPIDEIQITDDCSEYKYRDNQECADAIRTRREQCQQIKS